MKSLCLLLACCAVLSCPAMDRYMDVHDNIQWNPKMKMAAATFFGSGGAEELLGVSVLPDGRILVVGNSWGPPFPAQPPAVVLGEDRLWDIPLLTPRELIKGKQEFEKPSANHPNRTGFFVIFSPRLERIEQITRLGWGLASVSAVRLMRDGRLVIAGCAQRPLDSLPCPVEGRHRSAKPEESLRAIDSMFPGMGEDVFVAKMAADNKGFSWIWTMPEHRDPPDRLYEGKNGTVVFKQRSGLWRIDADGKQCRDYQGTPVYKMRSRLRGIGEKDGSIIIGGFWMSKTGREPYKVPWMHVYDSEGTLQAGYYEASGPLVGHDDFRLVSDSSVSHTVQTQDGRYAFIGGSDGGNTVFNFHPVDFTQQSPGTGLPMSMWGGGAQSVTTIVTFDPRNPTKCGSTTWLAMMPWGPSGLMTHSIQSMENGSLVVTGETFGFLVQTTQEHCRSTGHYSMMGGKSMGGGGPARPRLDANGWRIWQGLGAIGNYLAVFSPDLDALQWASVMPLCEHTSTAPVAGGGLVAVARCFGDDAKDGRTPAIMPYDVADYFGLVQTCVQAANGKPSQAERIWKRVPTDIRLKAEQWLKEAKPGQKPPESLQNLIRQGLEEVVFGARDLYDPALWPSVVRDEHHVALLRQGPDTFIPMEVLGVINRRLIEQALPTHIFAVPPSNRLRSKAGAQAAFGGGMMDGYIYLLDPPSGPLDLSKKPRAMPVPTSATTVAIGQSVDVKGVFGTSFQGSVTPKFQKAGYCKSYVVARAVGRLRPLFMHGWSSTGDWTLRYERDGILKDAQEIALKSQGSYDLITEFNALLAADIGDFAGKEWLQSGTTPRLYFSDFKNWKNLDSNAIILFNPKRGRLGTKEMPFGATFSAEALLRITALGKTWETRSTMKVTISDRDTGWLLRYDGEVTVPQGALGNDVPTHLRIVHGVLADFSHGGPSKGKGDKIPMDPDF